MKTLSLYTPSAEEADSRRIDELLATRKDILESYCTAFQPSPNTTGGRKVVLKLQKDRLWKSWTVEEKQFKKMLTAFSDDWYRILERDAERSEPRSFIEHQEGMEDGSQQRVDVSAKVDRQDVFGQKLHVLTVAMDLVRAFEMG
jgi:aspartate/tyrosine/aromatic aminotransferase